MLIYIFFVTPGMVFEYIKFYKLYIELIKNHINDHKIIKNETIFISEACEMPTFIYSLQRHEIWPIWFCLKGLEFHFQQDPTFLQGSLSFTHTFSFISQITIPFCSILIFSSLLLPLAVSKVISMFSYLLSFNLRFTFHQ